jgi:hypothetical protein
MFQPEHYKTIRHKINNSFSLAPVRCLLALTFRPERKDKDNDPANPLGNKFKRNRARSMFPPEH